MTSTIQTLQRRVGNFPIEWPAAGLMALAVAFVTLVMPDWRFERLIAATGLPGIIGAAQPPLGQTARVVAAIGLAGLAFPAVLFGLRALDRKETPTDFPAFRAADLHPDAPRRRPILAGAEFGAPANDLPPIEEQLTKRKPVLSEPLPSFLAPQPSAIGDFVPETTRTPEPDPEAGPEPVEAVFEEVLVPDLPGEVDELDDVAPFAEPTPFEVAPLAEPDFMEVPDVEAELTPPVVKRDVFSREVVEQDLEPEEDEAEPEQDVSQLMARLDLGLARRGSAPEPGKGGAAQEELRRALGDLNRISGRSK